MRNLVLIDGKSVFYRGYYAMGNLSKTDGTPTSGVYGFAVIAMEIVKRLDPEVVVVAWDKAGTSTAKRSKIYPEYKAGRARPPEDFYAQIPLLKNLIEKLSWNFVEIDEYEADDIIGTLAKQADDAADYMTYIVSSDLDMLQIVDKNTKMYRLLRGFSDLQEIDVAAVEEKYGILKGQFLELKALKGDASDNIPGVPGVGEKTAVKLLNAYGSLDGVYENIEQISGSLQKKLTQGKDSAYMSLSLARIMFDAPVELSSMRKLAYDKKQVISALMELEFRSLIRKYEEEFGVGSECFSGGVQDCGGSEGVVKSDGADDGDNGGRRGSRGDEGAEDNRSELERDAGVDEVILLPDIKKAMHDSDWLADKVLAGEKIWDLRQGEFLLNPLARRVEEKQLLLEMPVDERVVREKKYDKQQVLEYKRQKEEFLKYPKLYKIFTDFDLPLIPILYKMEKKGIRINRGYFAELSTEFTQKARKIEQEIYTISGQNFNVNSPIQLSEVLFSKMGISTKGVKKTTRGYSTNAKELEKLKDEHPIVQKVMEYREVMKLLSTYILPLPQLADGDDRVHTTFTQDVTATGRLSSTAPNLQNIPVRTEEGRRIRTGFVSDEGKSFVSADYSQFELRLAAVLASDQDLIDDFNSGVDIHTKTAARVFGISMEQVNKKQRRVAKVINFGVLYGMSPMGLSQAAGMSFYEAKRFIDDYFLVRKPIKEYLDNVLEQGRGQGYVETFFGRRRPTPDINSSNFVIRNAAIRAAQNMPIQGTEADLMKRAMILVDKKLPEEAHIVLQVHDSLVVECLDEDVLRVKEILRGVMENVAPELPIKLAVEVTTAKNWGDL